MITGREKNGRDYKKVGLFVFIFCFFVKKKGFSWVVGEKAELSVFFTIQRVGHCWLLHRYKHASSIASFRLRL